MPQIYIIPTVHANKVLGEEWNSIARYLIPIVEEAWGLENFNDVAVTVASPVIFVLGEKDVQIEIRYTAGKDEYGQGKPFDPTLEEQKKLIAQIKQMWKEFLEGGHFEPLLASVWCKPHYNSAFED